MEPFLLDNGVALNAWSFELPRDDHDVEELLCLLLLITDEEVTDREDAEEDNFGVYDRLNDLENSSRPLNFDDAAFPSKAIAAGVKESVFRLLLYTVDDDAIDKSSRSFFLLFDDDEDDDACFALLARRANSSSAFRAACSRCDSSDNVKVEGADDDE